MRLVNGKSVGLHDAAGRQALEEAGSLAAGVAELGQVDGEASERCPAKAEPEHAESGSARAGARAAAEELVASHSTVRGEEEAERQEKAVLGTSDDQSEEDEIAESGEDGKMTKRTER